MKSATTAKHAPGLAGPAVAILGIALVLGCSKAFEPSMFDYPDGTDDGADADADVDDGAGADTDVGPDADAEDDGDADAGCPADAGTDAVIGTACTDEADCCGAGLTCNENWGICVVPSCGSDTDFTPCEIVTDPDRSYDICVGGTCVSPGCGGTTCNAPGPNWTLPDTGQRGCYDGATTIACPGTAGRAECGVTPFCGQDAQYGWDTTHAPTERFARTVPVASQPIVADNVTGLVWQGCPAGMEGAAASCSGSASARRWADALSYCDGLTWGGFDDWRLPDRYELQSIMDYGVASGSCIDATAFPGTPTSYFWSSSSSAAGSGLVWSAVVSYGGVNDVDGTNTARVRCVRGEAVPRPARFTRTEPEADQFVVSDAVTGFVWQGCAAGDPGISCSETPAARTWQEALAYCERLNWGGRTDWHLPDVDGLTSLVDDRGTGPSIDIVAFPGAPSDSFWSSSSCASNDSRAWNVDFGEGRLDFSDKTGGLQVRCIRRDVPGIGDPCIDDGACTGGGMVCNENWGICVASDCTAEDDFTPCETETDPDRSYDICVGGTCVSPGCGDTTCNVPGPDWTLPDTGQRACYDNTASMTCAGTPGEASCGTTDFCGQDAQYGWDVAHASTERFTRTVPVATQPVVVDNVTGLVWQGCPAGKTGDAGSCSGSVSAHDWNAAVAYCDGLDWGGHGDWRLPDRYELLSIVDFGVAAGPPIDVTAFPGIPENPFWTSSTLAAVPSNAWDVGFGYGIVYYGDKTLGEYVLCVRRGPVSQPQRFRRSEPTVNQFVVTDTVTGLVWQGCAAGSPGTSCSESPATRTWQAALDYCEDLDWAGRSDWYLPSVDELASIVDDRRTGPSIDADAFPGTPVSYFWTSSSHAAGPSVGWRVGFNYGNANRYDKTNADSVRCVRQGP